jgi:hypothetical protein
MRCSLPDWVSFFAVALAIFFFFKWLTYRRGLASGIRAGRARSAGYLFLWPGMDAPRFLCPRGRPAPPRPAEWRAAWLRILIGAGLVWGGVRSLPAWPLLQGWVGTAGLILLLHFGCFHLLALLYQARGVEARPIMRAVLLARSPSDFWGRRWNLAFHQLVRELVYRPCRARGAVFSTSLAFLASGLVHDAAISLPARGGYGLPTGYFLLQGLGVLLERSAWGRKVGLGDGLRGRLFALGLAAGPAFLVFHPAFIRNVALPFLSSIGAL